MDNYASKNRTTNYFLTMAQLEAQQLTSITHLVSNIHLKDGLTRLNFEDEIKNYINYQLKTITTSDNEDVCQQCLQNLKQERENLSLQDQMLRSGEAVLHASVEFLKNGEVWGYVINAVGIVLASLQVVAGVGVMLTSLGTGNVIGTGFGSLLVLHGANNIYEEYLKLRTGENNPQGPLKGMYISAASFLGFDRSIGEIAYNTADLFLSAYGIVRLIRKPEAWRLFRFIRSDYVRSFTYMTGTDLSIEVINDTLTIKNIYDIASD